jgi:sugar phosphate isomerase/epimerase
VEGAQSWTLGYELLKAHIRYIVVKDFEWSKQDGRWYTKNIPIGTGMVDFDAFFQKLKADHFTGPISLHIEFPLYPDENLDIKEKTAAAIKTIRQEVQSTRALLTKT